MPPQMAPNRVVPTRSGVQYTPEQWAEKRELVTRLYAQEGKSLREVKEHLRLHHDFRPTDRMYQRKIQQWGLDKKHKAPEMRAILRLTRQREAAGRQSIFRVRGRRVDTDEVSRYFKRKGQDPSRLHLRDTSPIPSTVTVETPSSPIETVDDDDDNDDDFAEVPFELPPYQRAAQYPTPETEGILTSAAPSSAGPSTRSDSDVSSPLFFPGGSPPCQWVANYPQLTAPITPPLDDQCSRFLLHLTQFFFDVIVPPQFYSQEGANTVLKKPWRRTMSSWSQATSEGHELMQAGQAHEAVKLQSKAHGSVEKHIKNPSPIILFRYFEIIHTLRNSSDPRHQLFLKKTLEYVLQMAETVLKPGHPITQLTQFLLHPQVYRIIGPLARQGFQRSLEILFQRCGPLHPRILYVLDSRTQTLLDEHQYEGASRQAQLYLERAKLVQGPYSYESCQALRMLGDAYTGQDQFDRATEVYQKAFTIQKGLRSAKDRGVIAVKTNRGLAVVAMRRKRFQQAEVHLQEALKTAREAFGEKDVQVKLTQEVLNAVKKEREDVWRERGEFPYRPLDG